PCVPAPGPARATISPTLCASGPSTSREARRAQRGRGPSTAGGAAAEERSVYLELCEGRRAFATTHYFSFLSLISLDPTNTNSLLTRYPPRGTLRWRPITASKPRLQKRRVCLLTIDRRT